MKINIGQNLKKEFWLRRINPDSDTDLSSLKNYGSNYYVAPNFELGDGGYRLLTQEDFMREIEPSAHDINSRYMSTRPIYEVRERLNKDGKPERDENGKPITEWVIVGFEPLDTVRFGFQKRTAAKKSAHMAGNGFWISHENNSHEYGEILSSWKDSAGLDTAWQELVNSCYNTGDGAIYLYHLNGQIYYEVFSYLKGDILFPNFDEDHNPILYRLYTLQGVCAVDIYSCKYIETWIQDSKAEDDETKTTWWQRFSGWFAKGLDWKSTIVSEDGWRRISHKQTQTPDGLNQCVYWRVKDIPSGCAQQECEGLEKTVSYVSNGVKSQTLAPLFMKAEDIEMMPNRGSAGEIIGVKGAIDSIKAADAKFLTPPDISNIATIDIDQKKDSIMKSTLSVDITPDIFRSGADSSAAMKLLFTDEIIWCKNEFPVLFPSLRYFVEVFKALVDKASDSKGKIMNMRTSCGCDFWIPQNDSEVLKREVDQVAYRLKSRKSAMSDIGNNHPEDYEQIMKEWYEELDLKARVPAEAKAEVEQKFGVPNETIEVEEDNDVGSKNTNPNLNIDNAAKGKSITE